MSSQEIDISYFKTMTGNNNMIIRHLYYGEYKGILIQIKIGDEIFPTEPKIKLC